MMKGSKILGENEKQANKIAAKVMRITFLIFILVYLLNVMGVFIVDNVIMTIAFIGGSILLLLPTVLVNILKKEWSCIKYINVLCSVVFVTLLSITLTFHVVVIYVYPIAIASLYFSKRLNIVATAFTVVGVSIGQVLAFVLNTLQDDNFTDMNGVIIFGVIPRALILIAVAAIFTMLSQRTASLLSNLMGAEEQEKMLNHMKQMQENATHTSDTLVGMIKELGDITDTSLNANQQITEETERLLQGSMENATEAENADERMQAMTGQIQELSSMNNRTAALAEQIGEKTLENQNRMNDATSNMEEIYGSTEQCKQIISNLGDQSKEIVGIVETITAISGQTKVLALNASIEAARAGEFGKGFAVVAEEIQKLSQETQNAVESIGTIINQVTKNTEEAVVAMEKNVMLTQNGMESIQKANESTTQITASNEEMVGQILSINKAAEAIKEKSCEVSESMKQITDNAQQNYNAVEHVTAATQENSAGTESLAGVVEQIRELSEKLRLAVQGKEYGK